MATSTGHVRFTLDKGSDDQKQPRAKPRVMRKEKTTNTLNL